MRALGGDAGLRVRYELEGELGRGAGGVVYSARARADGCPVAIKIAHAPARVDASVGIAHEHLVEVREAASREDISYVVMERVDGCDLGRYLTRARRLPIQVAISLMARVAAALAYLHARGLAHGDVKPSNILYSARTGVVKLADFESAGAACRPARGTPAYRAPEQVCGAGPSAEADQFAFGVTLYRLLAGVLPFESASLPQLCFSIVHSRHASIQTHNGAVPHALAAVIGRMLKKAPRARYPDMDCVAGALTTQLRQGVIGDTRLACAA